MTKDEALKLARDALKNLPGFLADVETAIDACGEALAQQSHPLNPVLRDDTEHGKAYYLASDVDALLERFAGGGRGMKDAACFKTTGCETCTLPLPAQQPVELLLQLRSALALASAICDAVPNRESGHLGTLVNAQPDGSHGYRQIQEAEAALVKYLETPAVTQPMPEQEPVGCSFPERDQTKPAEQQGIFRKFVVQRVDGSDQPGGKHHGCEYFVLDMVHDKHAADALRAYAESCRHSHPELSTDLIARFGTQPKPQPQPLTNDQCRAAFENWYSSAPDAPKEPERIYELTDESMSELTKECIWLGWQAAHGIGAKP